MRNWIYILIVILTSLSIVGYSRFVPDRSKVHFDRSSQLRRWGRWCSFDLECGRGFCRGYVCQCYRGYISWYELNTCNYEQRTKQTAFILSFFIGMFGADWFYLSRENAAYVVAGIMKTIFSLGCVIGWLIIIRKSKKKEESILVHQVVVTILTLIIFIWWITDWLRILTGVFRDGNNAPLQPWDYYYYDNFQYSG